MGSGANNPFQWIRDYRQLRDQCTFWNKNQKVLAVDTEFIRQRSFYPQLALIQVYDGFITTIIDPLEIEDLSPFAALIDAPDITKVLHACNEDIEVFYTALQSRPNNVIDTQVLASFLGYGNAIGYGKLVLQLLGIELDKAHSRSNWLARPLADAQIHYAVDDVVFLLDVFNTLQTCLMKQSIWEWAYEDCCSLLDSERFNRDPEMAYLNIKNAWQLEEPHDLAVLAKLATWRERLARSRNIARNFVIHEDTLIEIAVNKPGSLRELGLLQNIKPVEIRRYGTRLLELVAAGLELSQTECPVKILRMIDIPGYKNTFKMLKNAVVNIAAEHRLPPELLFNRRQIDNYIRQRYLSSERQSSIDGWRGALLNATFEKLYP